MWRMEECPVMGENPWWHPGEDDLDWNEPLPHVIELAPDYCAELPLWGASWNIAWQYTKFSPGLLDRLAAWQREFDANFHWDTGWRSAAIRDHWASQAQELAADVRGELGTRAELTVRLWPLQDNDASSPPR
jgi:hypothetical protein